MAAKRKQPALRRAVVDPAQVGPLAEEIMPVGGGETPISAIGWFDSAGRPRRARVDYPNGWRVEFRISADGKLTSRRASLHLSTRKDS